MEVDPILAHDVIHDQGHRKIRSVVGQCFAETIVHIDLPVMRRTSGSHKLLGRWNIPLPLLKVHHRVWDEESMTAGCGSNACNI
jgi:hypothetical protein